MAHNVLIVDDSPAMRTFVRRVLSLSALETGDVYEAGNGREALEVLGQKQVQLVLTDVNMPVMNGEELVLQLAAENKLSGLKVIVISTDRTPIRMERMMELGAHGYVTKPFTPEALCSEFEKVMGAAYAKG